MAITDDAGEPDPRKQAAQKRKTVVLVPLDFSISPQQAVEFGIKIARDSDGLLLLAHVVDLTLTPYGPAVRARMNAELCKDAMKKAEPLLIAAREAGVKAICTVEEGGTASVVAKVAKRWAATVIVLGVPRRGILSRLFGRPIEQKLMDIVQCPVIVLQEDNRKRTP
ncbi:MAG: UspA domain protein [Pedosphaera sp.]|nr:UspA domain protein [Pedosphaera sp.]